MTTYIERYIVAWREHDQRGILELLTPDCTVIESFGPMYVGAARIAEWVGKWFADGAVVLDWKVRSAVRCDDREWAEWTFTYEWQDGRKSFDGATIATIQGDRIAHLREYATTTELYPWTGAWRTKG